MKTKRTAFQALGQRLLAVFFPERCLGCGQVIYPGQGLCPACRDKLPRVSFPVCPFCGCGQDRCTCRGQGQTLDGVVAPWYYEGVARAAILRFKDGGREYAAPYLAGHMHEHLLACCKGILFDGIVYVPMHKADLQRRGFNQSHLLAQELGQLLNLPVLDILIKVQQTAPQKGLNAAARAGNVLGVFDIDPSAADQIQGKTLLLVDDVITTGATLHECAKMLKIYGAGQVIAATLCTTSRQAEVQ